MGKPWKTTEVLHFWTQTILQIGNCFFWAGHSILRRRQPPLPPPRHCSESQRARLQTPEDSNQWLIPRHPPQHSSEMSGDVGKLLGKLGEVWDFSQKWLMRRSTGNSSNWLFIQGFPEFFLSANPVISWFDEGLGPGSKQCS